MATDRRGPDRRILEIVRALKLAKPASLTATTADGDETEIALTGQRGRYDRAARTLLAIGAVLVACVDSDGRVTETIRVGGTTAEEEASAVAASSVRTREQELAQLMRVALDAQDKNAARYEAQLREQRELLGSVTNAAIGVMRVASDRAAKLESAVVRLVLVRERELDGRERELRRIAAGIASADERDDDEASGDMDPAVQKVIDIAAAAFGVNGPAKNGSGKAPDNEETETEGE